MAGIPKHFLVRLFSAPTRYVKLIEGFRLHLPKITLLFCPAASSSPACNFCIVCVDQKHYNRYELTRFGIARPLGESSANFEPRILKRIRQLG